MCEFLGRPCESHSVALASERSTLVQRTHRMTDFYFLSFLPSSARERLASVVRPCCCWLGKERLSCSDSCWHYHPGALLGRGAQTWMAGAVLVKRPRLFAPNLEMLLLRSSSMGKRFLPQEADRINLWHVLHLPFPTVMRQWASAPGGFTWSCGLSREGFLRLRGAAAWLILAESGFLCTRGLGGGGPGCTRMQMSSVWSWVVVGLLIIKSCTDLICGLLTFKQLIISNPLPWPIWLWNKSAKVKLVLFVHNCSSSLCC